jgi:hypothetical protein
MVTVFERFSLAYYYNLLWVGDSSYLFAPLVNSSNTFETIAYTLLIPAGNNSVFATYNKYQDKHGRSLIGFFSDASHIPSR